MKNYDLVVIGAGSGGIGAALSAARLGLNVLLLERQDRIGGNAAQSGVSVWEMGVGGTGIPFDIYKRLKKIPAAVGIYHFYAHRKWQLARGEKLLHIGADLRINSQLKYRDTLLRHGSKTGIENEDFVRKFWHGVPFEPAAYQWVVEAMLAETRKVTLLKNRSFVAVQTDHNRVVSITLDDGEMISAANFVDSTDSGTFCRQLNCALMYGQESQSIFGEPSAPEQTSSKINGISLIYRVKPRFASEVDPLPANIPDTCWWAKVFPLASVVEYPNGDLNINMLPTMEGVEFNTYTDPRAAYAECQRRVLAHWHYVQMTYPPYQSYQFSEVSPVLGVREGSRVVGEYILKEQDLRAGLSKQVPRDIITIADHALDTHGVSTSRAGCAELDEPYGVPYRCMIPKGFQNVLVASRAASFSSLAASSCRLSRTMMQLGQAAGTAAYLAKTQQVELADVPYPALRQALQEQWVQLDYPASAELEKHLDYE